MEVKQAGLKISSERVWDRTAFPTGVNRATAQRILNKKVEQQIPSIEDEIWNVRVLLWNEMIEMKWWNKNDNNTNNLFCNS